MTPKRIAVDERWGSLRYEPPLYGGRIRHVHSHSFGSSPVRRPRGAVGTRQGPSVCRDGHMADAGLTWRPGERVVLGMEAGPASEGGGTPGTTVLVRAGFR